MKHFGIAILAVIGTALVQAQEPPFSKQYLPAQHYAQKESEALVMRFHGLRVTGKKSAKSRSA